MICKKYNINNNEKLKWNKMEKKFISLVVYLHNDADRIESFMNRVLPVVRDSFEQFELICVDDGCTDATIGILKEYVSAHEMSEMVSVIHMGFYQGMESAMNAGRDAAIGDFVYEFDDILVDYEPELIFRIYETMLTGYDIVSASADAKMPVSSRMFYALYNKYSHSSVEIGSETFRIVSRRAINRIKSMGAYIPYRKAVYANCGLNMIVVSYESRNVVTAKGSDKRADLHKGMGIFSERGGLALDSFIYFTNIMERLSAVISAVCLAFTLFMVIYTVADYLIEGSLAEGWASTMCIISLGFFGVFALLTFILKYLSVLLNLIFKQQKYLVADIEKIVSK